MKIEPVPPCCGTGFVVYPYYRSAFNMSHRNALMSG